MKHERHGRNRIRLLAMYHLQLGKSFKAISAIVKSHTGKQYNHGLEDLEIMVLKGYLNHKGVVLVERLTLYKSLLYLIKSIPLVKAKLADT